MKQVVTVLDPAVPVPTQVVVSATGVAAAALATLVYFVSLSCVFDFDSGS